MGLGQKGLWVRQAVNRVIKARGQTGQGIVVRGHVRGGNRAVGQILQPGFDPGQHLVGLRDCGKLGGKLPGKLLDGQDGLLNGGNLVGQLVKTGIEGAGSLNLGFVAPAVFQQVQPVGKTLDHLLILYQGCQFLVQLRQRVLQGGGGFGAVIGQFFRKVDQQVGQTVGATDHDCAIRGRCRKGDGGAADGADQIGAGGGDQVMLADDMGRGAAHHQVIALVDSVGAERVALHGPWLRGSGGADRCCVGIHGLTLRIKSFGVDAQDLDGGQLLHRWAALRWGGPRVKPPRAEAVAG